MIIDIVEFKKDIGTLENKIQSTEERMNSRLKKLLKQRPLDHAILYVVRHPELMSAEPITTERLLLCCWNSQSSKNLRIVLDLLVENGIVITLDEINKIVESFVKDGLEKNWNIHRYIQYLNFVHAYKIPIEIWTEYFNQVLTSSNKHLVNKISDDQLVESDITNMVGIMMNIYKNTWNSTDKTIDPYFTQILDSVFRQLNSFMNQCNDHIEKKKKRESIFRPIFLSLLENHISLNSLLKNNEFYSKLVIDELVIWGCESQEIFKALFLKINFENENLPWSVFKGIKDELKRLEKENLYFYVTKYFLDNFSEKEELCDYVFTSKEYKSLVKHFLDNCEKLKEDEGLIINDKNEAEFEGFVIIE